MKISRTRALLAIAFTGSIFNSGMPAVADNQSESKNSLVHQFAIETAMTPELRAFWLLKLAGGYLSGRDQNSVEAEYRRVFTEPELNHLFKSDMNENMFVREACSVSQQAQVASSAAFIKNESYKNSHPVSKENAHLAELALLTTLTLLDQVPDKFAKLNMYFIASKLFKEVGESDSYKKCSDVLTNAFKDSESKSQIDEASIRASSSVLNSMAYGLIPISISDTNPQSGIPSQAETFSEEDFKNCKKLKLRAVAMTDRLDATNHLRRKAHRDMALWYSQLGKTELAQQQKQILFELVGCHDDSILFPRQASNGRLIWWQKGPVNNTCLGCGMG
jgi:hypothetical protein